MKLTIIINIPESVVETEQLKQGMTREEFKELAVKEFSRLKEDLPPGLAVETNIED